MSNNLNLFNRLPLRADLYPFPDKEYCLYVYHTILLQKTLNMFKYDGLPESVPERELERILQTTGNVTFVDYNDTYYAIAGRLGAELDAYYLPTKSICVQPWPSMDRTYDIGKDCEVIYNNSTWNSIFTYADKYFTQMLENDITQNLANINMRMMNIITCATDDNKAVAEKYIKDMIRGKLSALVTDSAFIGDISTQPYSSGSGNQVTQLIEYAQYLKGSVNNLFGFADNLNIKREYVSDSELDMYNQPMNQIVYDMLQNRIDGVERINKLFGLNISVKLNDKLFPEKREQVDENVEQPEEITEESEIAEESSEQPVEEVVNDAEEETVSEEQQPTEEVEQIAEAIEEVAEAIEELVDEVKDGDDDADVESV